LDPVIDIVGTEKQVDILFEQLDKQIKNNEKTFVVVLTIKMAEELTILLHNKGYKVAYLHNEVTTIDRTIILNDLRRGKYDLIIGINLLREGLDIPEVSLICVFDADKPGFLRDEKSLIQIFGRAARNVNGRVLLFADHMTKDMKNAIDETTRRRNIQITYNKEHNIVPKTINKAIFGDLRSNGETKAMEALFHKQTNKKNASKSIALLRKQMLEAAKNKEYEKAAYLRDLLLELESRIKK
jgi:excinuclease ABC subunit B